MMIRRMLCAGVLAGAMAWAMPTPEAVAWTPGVDAVDTAQASETIPSRDFDALLEEVERSRRGSEQLELIEIMTESYRFEAKQARELVTAVSSRDRVEAAAILYPSLENPRKFFIVLAALDEDEREEVRRVLRLDEGPRDGFEERGVDKGKSGRDIAEEEVEDAPEPMSKSDFKSFKKDLKKVARGEKEDAADAARLTLLEFAVDDNNFTSRQARELVEMMRRGDSKVEVAAMLYPRVTNPEKFFLVLAALESDTDRRLVQRRIDKDYTDKDFMEDVVGPIDVEGKTADGSSVKVRVDRKSDRPRTGGDAKKDDDTSTRDTPRAKPKAMSDAAFLDFKKQVAGESFSDDKINLVKMVSSNAYFTSAQVRELLDVFSFENDKVEVAALLYKRTIDKKYFYKVFEAFTFSSSKDELRERIGL